MKVHLVQNSFLFQKVALKPVRGSNLAPRDVPASHDQKSVEAEILYPLHENKVIRKIQDEGLERICIDTRPPDRDQLPVLAKLFELSGKSGHCRFWLENYRFLRRYEKRP